MFTEKEAALDYIYNNLYKNVFFTTLADCGYTPRNIKEAEDYLSLAMSINLHKNKLGNIKTASYAYDHDVQLAAYQLANSDPNLYRAVLTAAS